MKTDWLRLTLEVDRESSDHAAAACWALNTVGLSEQALADGNVCLEAFFQPTTTPAHLLELVICQLREMAVVPRMAVCAGSQDDSQKWLDNIRRHFTSQSIGVITIHPPWETPPSSQFTIELEPGHGFGTGTHESTRLCLLALQDTSGKTVLDVGTGSGILAIAAHKLFPGRQITAIDNDPLAIDAARENLERNNSTSIGLVVGGPEAISGEFELVLANLTLAIFSKIADSLGPLVSRELIVSGFTADQRPQLLNHFKGWNVIGERLENDWCCYRLTPPDAAEPGIR